MALQRVSLGFYGSQPLSLKVEEPELDKLFAALAEGEWHDITADDGTVRVNLKQVIYVRTDRDGQRVGFGA